LSGIGRITELFTRFFRTLLVHLGLMELILAFLLFLFIFVMPHFLADYIPLLNEVGLQFDRRFIPMCMSWLTNFMVNYKVIIVPLYFLIIVSLYFLIVGSPLFLQRRSNKDIFLLLSIIRKIPLLKKYAISAELAITSNIFISLVDGKILAEELFIDMSPNADIAQVIYKGYQKKVENNAIDTENLEIEFNLSSIDAFETTFKKMMFTTEVLTEVLIVASSAIMVILILISLFMPKFGF
jgi:hypothetical protein